jgi:hypothetical protein
MAKRFCDEFVGHPSDPHGGTYCKLLDGHEGPCSPHYASASAAKHREDGWPLCPQCGEDELYSLADPPSVGTFAGCYRCGPVAKCTCTPKDKPSVIGACACDTHGMKALRAALGMMVDLYRHPNGGLLIEDGDGAGEAGEIDRALRMAVAALGDHES